MKAKVKATGEIVYIERNIDNCRGGYVASDGKIYNACDLELIVDEEPDYWTRLEHQYAGMAMQQLVHLVNMGYEHVYEETAIVATNFAHALVEKLKKKEERK